jgi:hypothetical protein
MKSQAQTAAAAPLAGASNHGFLPTRSTDSGDGFTVWSDGGAVGRLRQVNAKRKMKN